MYWITYFGQSIIFHIRSFLLTPIDSNQMESVDAKMENIFICRCTVEAERDGLKRTSGEQ